MSKEEQKRLVSELMEKANKAHQQIVNMRIDDVSWSITRDTQSEGDRDNIRENSDPNWEPFGDSVSYEDGKNIVQLIEEEKL
jgi:hypothetical protein